MRVREAVTVLAITGAIAVTQVVVEVPSADADPTGMQWRNANPEGTGQPTPATASTVDFSSPQPRGPRTVVLDHPPPRVAMSRYGLRATLYTPKDSELGRSAVVPWGWRLGRAARWWPGFLLGICPVCAPCCSIPSREARFRRPACGSFGRTTPRLGRGPETNAAHPQDL
jgi:hypothetical protein